MASPADGSDLLLTQGGVTDRLRKVLERRGATNLLVLPLVLALLAWLPAAVLSLIDWLSGSPKALAFFTDLTTYARSLVAVPLLVLADTIIDLHVSDADGRLHELLGPGDQARLDAIDKTVSRMANRPIVAIAAAILAYLPLMLRFTGVLHEGGEAWIFEAGGSTPSSAAGFWYALVAIPLFSFLLLLWVWRYLVWIWFLWKVSRLPLLLVPSHPDRVGGLGFMDQVQGSFFPLVGAVSVPLAAAWAEAIQSGQSTSQSYAVPFGVFVVAVLLIFILPTLGFFWSLMTLRVRGQRSFDFLVTRYNREFESRWVSPRAVDSPLGSPDIQSLNDMDGAFNTSHRMRIYIVSVLGAVPLLAAAVLPMLLPAGISVPLVEIAGKLLGHLM